MNATLDQLANMRRTVESPGFRVRTAEEHHKLNMIDCVNSFSVAAGCEPPPEPPLGPESAASKAGRAELLKEIDRLEREVKKQRLEVIRASEKSARRRK